MSSHAFQELDFSLIKKKCTLYAIIDFGSSGAPTLKAWTPATGGSTGAYSNASTTGTPYSPAGTQGVAKIVRNSTGDYTLTLQQVYQRLLSVKATWLDSATLAAANVTSFGIPAPIVSVKTDGTNVGTAGGGTIEFTTWAPTPGTPAVFPLIATDPASGERLALEIVLDDSGTL